MRKVVCVPYREDTLERAANWNRTRGQWEGWEVFVSDSDGETFGRSQACNRAAALAGDWEAAVFADCDLLLESGEQALWALETALRTRGYITCYYTFYYLTEIISQRVREGRVPTPAMAYYSLTQIWGGAFAIHREPWDAVGGFNEQFVSWGGEDGQLLRRVRDLDAHMAHAEGAVYHLKHPLVPGAR